MNEKLIKILKFFSRSIGFLLINFSLILILFAFFINSGINNIDSLKDNLQSFVNEELSQNINQNDLNQIKEYCNKNLQDEKCKQLSQIDENKQFNQIFESIKSAKKYLVLLILSSLTLFLLGFMLVYFGTFNLLISGYKISIHLTINNFIAALYFNFIPDLVNLTLNNSQIQELTKEIPKEIIEKIAGIVLNWIEIPLFLTVRLTLILGVIFLIISVIF